MHARKVLHLGQALGLRQMAKTRKQNAHTQQKRAQTVVTALSLDNYTCTANLRVHLYF